MTEFLIKVCAASFCLAVSSQFFGLSTVLFFTQIGYVAAIASVFAFILESIF